MYQVLLTGHTIQEDIPPERAQTLGYVLSKEIHKFSKGLIDYKELVANTTGECISSLEVFAVAQFIETKMQELKRFGLVV